MPDKIKRNPIFNPKGDDNTGNRTIIKGDTTGLFQLNDVKYKWATSLYTLMMGNFWIPEKIIGLGEDAIQLEELSEAEKRAYKGILSFLIFLDSIQTVNLPNFNDYITAPEVNLILSIQAYQEAIHSQSYATILETVVEPKDRDEIYYFWRTDKHLLERNEFIGNIYQEFIDNPTDKTFFRGVIGNFLLESIYFYNGFAFFHTLADQGKMLASDKMISYIQRDEECLHPNTEVLTSTGWKYIEQVTLDDKVAQIDTTNQELSFEKPSHKTWRDYNGNMYKIKKGETTWQNISEGHDLLVNNCSTKPISLVKENVKDSKFHPYKTLRQGGIKQDNLNQLSYMNRLNIAIQADGTVDKQRTGVRNGYQVVKFGLKKQRKINRLFEIIKHLEGIIITEHQTKKDIRIFYIKIPINNYKVYKHFNWVEIEEFNTDMSTEFIKELMLWDGYIGKNRHNSTYINTNKVDIDIVQQLCVIGNLKQELRKTIDTRKDSYKDCYKLDVWGVREYTQTQHISTGNLTKEVYHYKGKIGCVTMPKGTIITRYNGNVCVTGNCHITIFANILREIRREFPDVYDEEMIIDMMRTAVNQEIKWSKHILGEGIIGMGHQNIENYTKWLANSRLSLLGIKPIYDNVVSNPFKHLERFEDPNMNKGNFFESTIINYSQSSAVNGSWEF